MAPRSTTSAIGPAPNTEELAKKCEAAFKAAPSRHKRTSGLFCTGKLEERSAKLQIHCDTGIGFSIRKTSLANASDLHPKVVAEAKLELGADRGVVPIFLRVTPKADPRATRLQESVPILLSKLEAERNVI